MPSDAQVTILPECARIDVGAEVPCLFPDPAGYAVSQALLVGPEGAPRVLVRYDPRRVARLGMRDRAYPAALAKAYGASTLVFVVPAFDAERAGPGAGIYVVRDHINLLGDNPLIGASEASGSSRFLDLSGAYNADLRNEALGRRTRNGLNIAECLYIGVKNFNEDAGRAVAALREFGPVLCGPWLVPEVIAARSRGVNVLAFACATGAQLAVDWAGEEEWYEELGRMARLAVSGREEARSYRMER